METFDISSFSFIPTLVTSVVSGLITWLGTFLFYRQKRDGMDIANEAQRSAEWKKLYDESKQDSEQKDKKIDELRREINALRNELLEVRGQVQLNGIYRCEVLKCVKRRPPIVDKPRNAKGQFVKQSDHEAALNENNEPDDQLDPSDALYHSEQPEPPMD